MVDTYLHQPSILDELNSFVNQQSAIQIVPHELTPISCNQPFDLKSKPQSPLLGMSTPTLLSQEQMQPMFAFDDLDKKSYFDDLTTLPRLSNSDSENSIASVSFQKFPHSNQCEMNVKALQDQHTLEGIQVMQPISNQLDTGLMPSQLSHNQSCSASMHPNPDTLEYTNQEIDFSGISVISQQPYIQDLETNNINDKNDLIQNISLEIPPISSPVTQTASKKHVTKRGRKRKPNKGKRDRSVASMSPDRLERVRYLGRLAARRSRARRKAELKKLQEQETKLAEEKSKLLTEKDQLRDTIADLRAQIVQKVQSGNLPLLQL